MDNRFCFMFRLRRCTGGNVAANRQGRVATAMAFVCVCASAAPVFALPVYTDYFIDGERHTGWTLPDNAAAGRTPAGIPTFGPFLSSPVSLRLEKLPDHQLLVVAIDLQLIGPWGAAAKADPSGVPAGTKFEPSLFNVIVDSPTPRFRSSFAMETPDVQVSQSYPDPEGISTHPAGSGAMEVASLGYGSIDRPNDAVYRILVAVRHSDGAADITFVAENLPMGASWALGSISVEVYKVSESSPTGIIGPTLLDAADFGYSHAGSGGVDGLPPNIGQNYGGGGGGGGGGSGGGSGGGGGSNSGGPPVPSPGVATTVLVAMGVYAMGRRRR